ncbi:divalent anion:sodium symporter family protein [Aeromonas salmonicida]|uniref:SLC13 family permease n=1 Tax=Aeromonas salmonicida TaxID=645 RepID=UPI00102638E4|nr:SLC13 family permease [Aeromonas salmonicida]VFB09094.1 divalent anion:sodium symporter family protein [Aeromonas salmonicida]
MTWQQSLVLGLLAALVALLIQGKLRPALLFSGAVLITYLSGLADINAVVAGYTNSALLTLVLLLLVSLAVEKTRIMSWFANLVGSGSFNKVLIKLWFSTAFLSAFVNNTAVVASMLGAVKRNPNHAPSRLLLPMCFAATFGGVLTLIGTSTNLIVNSFLIKMGAQPLGMFDFFMVGAGTLLTGLVAVLLFARYLPEQDTEMSRESGYFLEAKVGAGSPLAGRSVKENGLRSLKSLYLAEIIRGDQVICPVQPEHELHEGDVLLFCGEVESVGVLQEMKGLDLYGQHRLNGQHLVEVIVSHSSRLVGQSIKDAEFRTHFDAVVLAVRRGETQLTGGLGQIELHAGDTLLLAPGPKFASNKSLSREFVVVSGLEASTRLDGKRSAAVVLGFLGVLALSVFELVPLFKGLLMMLVVGGALAIADQLEKSGLARVIADWLMGEFNGSSPIIAFIGIYLFTLVLTELMSNNAAAALAFPMGYQLALSMDVSTMPFILAVLFGASSSFILPYGYQTNLMVYAAGNYKMPDYLKLALPVSLAYSLGVIIMVPLLFPF